jgi:hypothetical protein
MKTLTAADAHDMQPAEAHGTSAANSPIPNVHVVVPKGRVGLILSMLRKGMNLREIARQLKFTDHRDLALYMKSKGYLWDEDEATYVFAGVVSAEPADRVPANKAAADAPPRYADNKAAADVPRCSSPENAADAPRRPLDENAADAPPRFPERHAALLEFLERNKEALETLLSGGGADAATIPRYILPGVHITKSVHMLYSLDQLVKEYSQERNISQKDIFEVALVDFFRKYGYREEIGALMGSKNLDK